MLSPQVRRTQLELLSHMRLQPPPPTVAGASTDLPSCWPNSGVADLWWLRRNGGEVYSQPLPLALALALPLPLTLALGMALTLTQTITLTLTRSTLSR